LSRSSIFTKNLHFNVYLSTFFPFISGLPFSFSCFSPPWNGYTVRGGETERATQKTSSRLASTFGNTINFGFLCAISQKSVEKVFAN
jgi:hypothetical protein